MNTPLPDTKQDNATKPKHAPLTVYHKFFKYTKNRWKLGLFAVITTTLSGVIVSIFPWKLGQLLDLVTKQIDNNVHTAEYKQSLVIDMLELTLITLMIALFTFLRTVSLEIFQEKIAIDLRQ